jgi:flagellar hook-basal body complex protein FliE
MPVIDTSRIEAMVAQLKAAEARLQGGLNPLGKAGQTTEKGDFASALKTSLDQVNNVQTKADQLGQRFVAGDDSVNLSDVMISMQKANISFQATVQVRNKLVAAYQDIMNMAV